MGICDYIKKETLNQKEYAISLLVVLLLVFLPGWLFSSWFVTLFFFAISSILISILAGKRMYDITDDKSIASVTAFLIFILYSVYFLGFILAIILLFIPSKVCSVGKA